MSTKILNEDSYTEEWMPKSQDLRAKFEKDVKEWNVTLAELLLLLTRIYKITAKMEADENTPKEEESDESAALYQLRMAIIAMDNKRLEIVGFASRISDELRDGLKFDPNLEEKVDEIKKFLSNVDYYNMWQYLTCNGIEIPEVLGNRNYEATVKIIHICEKAMGHKPTEPKPSTNIETTRHPIVKHLKYYFKPGKDGEDGKYVSPFSNSQIKYNDMTVEEAIDIVEVARAFMFTVMDIDEVHILRKKSSGMWWYKYLPPRAQVLVSAIHNWKKYIETSSKSEGQKIKARHAIKELEKAGLSKKSNKDVFARFFDEANRDVSMLVFDELM